MAPPRQHGHKRRADSFADSLLEQIIQATGSSISDALKRGILLLRDEISRQAGRVPYDIHAELDLGPGGYATTPSTETRRGVQEAIRRKLGGRKSREGGIRSSTGRTVLAGHLQGGESWQSTGLARDSRARLDGRRA